MQHTNQSWDAIRGYLQVESAGVGVTGESPTVVVQRLSDGLFLEAGGLTWGATAASLAMTEVDAVNFPGLYVYIIATSALVYEDSYPGYLFHKTNATPDVVETELVVPQQRPAIEGVALLGAVGDAVFTVEDTLSTPIQGALVRVYDSAGTELLTQGITDASGNVTFGLPLGSYQVRVSADGYDFSGINPTSVTVVANDDVTPELDGIVPSTGALEGERIALHGRFFGDTNVEVVFGTISTVTLVDVNTDQTVATCVVPAGTTGLTVPIRIQKLDPANQPSGRLQSGAISYLVG